MVHKLILARYRLHERLEAINLSNVCNGQLLLKFKVYHDDFT